MAQFTGTIWSEVLQMRTTLHVVTPKEPLKQQPGGKVVYLLHGLSDCSEAWYGNAQLTMLADDYNLTFILPEVQRGFYIDMAYGLNYFTYISEELPKICETLFQIPTGRENTYVMGLSMGGYGALKCALKCPERYAGCGAFSAACILQDVVEMGKETNEREMRAILGMNYELFAENDLKEIALECEKKNTKPDIFMTCGTEDFIYHMSVEFRDFMKEVSIPFTYREWEGVHEWYFWNKSLHLACEHFFARVNPENYCNIQ